MNRVKLLFVLIVLLFPLTGCTAQEEEALQQFPAFSGVADNGYPLSILTSNLLLAFKQA